MARFITALEIIPSAERRVKSIGCGWSVELQRKDFPQANHRHHNQFSRHVSPSAAIMQMDGEDVLASWYGPASRLAGRTVACRSNESNSRPTSNGQQSSAKLPAYARRWTQAVGDASYANVLAWLPSAAYTLRTPSSVITALFSTTACGGMRASLSLSRVLRTARCWGMPTKVS